MSMRIARFVSAFAGALILPLAVCAEDAAAPAPQPLYGKVNGKSITQKDFHTAYATYLRQKYYHGKVPEDQLLQARKEVNDLLVDRILLLDEAKRRGLAADEPGIAKIIAEYDSRYANSEVWQKSRESMLPGLKQQLTEQNLLNQLETAARAIAEPSDASVREFYKTRLELFTEPEKMHLHTILLKVDPGAAKSVWDAAREEAGRIVARLQSGQAKFEDLAKLHSHDSSSEQGGDLGYLHRGMIPEQVVAQLEKLPRGSIGAPIDVLEGIAVFRLDEITPPQVKDYPEVAERARQLLKRELSNQAWAGLIAGLRKNATIEIMEPPAAAVANAAAPAATPAVATPAAPAPAAPVTAPAKKTKKKPTKK